MKRLIIVMGGSTGAGKTTHGKLIALGGNWTYISTGEIARNLMDDQTDALFAEGQLSPHEDKIRRTLHIKLRHSKIAVLDGFPRIEEQYEQLLTWADQLDAHIFLVWLMPSRAVLEHRWNTRHRDKFDTPAAAIKRDELYQTKTLPILEQLAKVTSNAVIKIGDKDAEIGEVYKSIAQALLEFRYGKPKERQNG